MMQEWIVGAIVACAFFSAARRYLPKSLRRALRSASVRAVRRLGWEGLAQRLAAPRESGGSCADGCGSCGGCGTEPAPADDGKRFVIPIKSLKRTASR